jgi:hypothetical protein
LVQYNRAIEPLFRVCCNQSLAIGSYEESPRILCATYRNPARLHAPVSALLAKNIVFNSPILVQPIEGA